MPVVIQKDENWHLYPENQEGGDNLDPGPYVVYEVNELGHVLGNHGYHSKISTAREVAKNASEEVRDDVEDENESEEEPTPTPTPTPTPEEGE